MGKDKSRKSKPSKPGQCCHKKALAHLAWPKFCNIHSVLARKKKEIDPEDQVLVLEKLDGSDLGLEINPNEGLVAVHGRKYILWHSGLAPELPLNRRFGPLPDTLECLAQDIIPKLTLMSETLLSKIRAETVIFYGEWYKDVHREKYSSATWIPFGFAIYDNNVKDDRGIFHTMTSKYYQLFLDHGLQPPEILFSNGTLAEAVDALYERMIDPPHPQFEGVFITPDGTMGGSRSNLGACKWKTGPYEEQPKFLLKDKLVTSETMREMVYKMRVVYETKVNKLKPYKSAWRADTDDDDEDEVDFGRQIRLALHSTMSKSVPVENMGPDEIDGLAADTLADLKETLEASDTVYTLSQLEDRVTQAIQELIPKNKKYSYSGIRQ